MPQYKSKNDEVRYYPTLGLLIEPNETIELAEKIDAVGLEEVSAKASKPAAQIADASAEGVSING